MKPTTAIILGAAGLAVVYFVTRPTTSPALSLGGSTSKGNTLSNAFGALGGLLGGFVSSSNGSLQNVFSGPSSGSSQNISPLNYGITPQEVRALDSVNVGEYDAQGSPDAPVYGIAGLDY